MPPSRSIANTPCSTTAILPCVDTGCHPRPPAPPPASPPRGPPATPGPAPGGCLPHVSLPRVPPPLVPLPSPPPGSPVHPSRRPNHQGTVGRFEAFDRLFPREEGPLPHSPRVAPPPRRGGACCIKPASHRGARLDFASWPSECEREGGCGGARVSPLPQRCVPWVTGVFPDSRLTVEFRFQKGRCVGEFWVTPHV